jgi:septal ring factor EnvC (AmiA/AmiB activator)
MSYQKRSQLLDIISEYKSDNLALKSQITDLKKQLDDAEARIKRLLIRLEQFEDDNHKETKDVTHR